jgi:hypothetical protein
MVLLFKLMFGSDIAAKGFAQWEAGLSNIKAILEAGGAGASNAQAVPQRIANSAHA